MAESRGVGIIRSGDTSILFFASLFDPADAKIATGTATLRLWRLIPTSGNLSTYDFNDNTFKTGAITTPTVNMNYVMAENASYDTGVWTYRHTSLGGFDVGDKYIAEISHADLARPLYLTFQYGDLEGDEATLVPDLVWDEVLSGHSTAGTSGLALSALGVALSARSNNATLNDLLGVPDIASRTLAGQVWEEAAASHNSAGTLGALLNAAGAGASAPSVIADAVWDELRAGHTTASTFGKLLQDIFDLVTVGGGGDLTYVAEQVAKIDQAATDGPPTADSLADAIASGSSNREYIIAVNISGTTLRLEVARETLGIVDTSPTTASCQIFNAAGGLVYTISAGDFGAINARGFFGFNWVGHALVAGSLYEFKITIDSDTTTKVVKILASA